MKKKLMNEILPAPSAAPSPSDGSARRRVLEHMRKLIGVGAATVGLSACGNGGGSDGGMPPFGVVDPLPQPARCKTIGDLISDLHVTVAPSGQADAGTQLLVTLTVAAIENDQGQLAFTGASGATGGSIVSTVLVGEGGTFTVDVTGPMVELFLDFSCDGAIEAVHALIDPSSLTVRLTPQ